jgi:23S rRNA (guanosine2251-2'-O)-methyltransferase
VEYLYGRNAVAEALNARRRQIRRLLIAEGARGIEERIALARQLRVPVEPAPRQRLDELVQGAHHQGIIAVAAAFPYTPLVDLLGGVDEPVLLLLLDSLQDPQNFGTLLRTAQACGVTGVVIPEHRAVGVTPAVSNASAGAVEHLRVARETNLSRAVESLKAHNVWTYGLAVDANQSFWDVDWRARAALVVGSEGSGLSRLVSERCDALITIPMAPNAVQSLNAATAGSLVLYEAFLQRQRAAA